MQTTHKPLTMVQTPTLPIHVLFNEFVHGDTFTTALADKVLRVTFMDETINYLGQLTKVKRFLTHHAALGLGLNVIVINTRETVDDLTMVMMVRYINVCHKVVKPIVINDKIVYLPESLAHFESKKILGYVQASVALIKHQTLAPKRPEPLVKPYHAPSPLPSTHPRKGQYQAVNLSKKTPHQLPECV
jgi:hypothetical protein